MASGGGGPVFGGTTQKCTACDKTVYLMDQLAVDNRVYHQACFRCHHCKGTLKLSNYSSFEGVLYCKPHFDQLFKMTGSLDKSFEGATKASKVDKSIANEGYSMSKMSSIFLGTQDKCVACKKTVYPIEKIAVDGNSYHRPCFRCAHSGCVISPSNYVAHEGRLYCKHHHSQLFMHRGNFSQLDKHESSKESIENPSSADSENVKKEDENLLMEKEDVNILVEKGDENLLVISDEHSAEDPTSELAEKMTENPVPE